MSKYILNIEQQKQVKELSEPVFTAVEKLLGVMEANKDRSTYANVQKATLELNKLLFRSKDSTPTWELEEIRKALVKLVHSVPRMSRSFVSYKELQDYLEILDKPMARIAPSISFLDQIKQKLGLGIKKR